MSIRSIGKEEGKKGGEVFWLYTYLYLWCVFVYPCLNIHTLTILVLVCCSNPPRVLIIAASLSTE